MINMVDVVDMYIFISFKRIYPNTTGDDGMCV